MKKVIAAALASLMVFAVSGCGSSAAPSSGSAAAPSKSEAVPAASGSSTGAKYEWTLSCGNAEGTTQADAAHYFAKLLKEKSNGDINVTVYAGGTLGSALECIGGVQMGSIDFIVESSCNFANYTNAMKVFDLPYLFDSNEAARAALSSDAARGQMDAMSADGFKGISYFEVGMYAVASSKPVKTLSDFANIRVRTSDSEVHAAAYSSLGAMPVVIAWGDIYTSVQQGVIDAVSSTAIPNMFAMNFYEVAPYITVTNHCYSPSICVMNNDLWGTLPADIQTMIMECAEEARQYDYKICDEVLKSNMEAMEAAGTTFYEIDVPEWASKVQGVYEQYVGKDGVDASVVAELQKAAKA